MHFSPTFLLFLMLAFILQCYQVDVLWPLASYRPGRLPVINGWLEYPNPWKHSLVCCVIKESRGEERTGEARRGQEGRSKDSRGEERRGEEGRGEEGRGEEGRGQERRQTHEVSESDEYFLFVFSLPYRISTDARCQLQRSPAECSGYNDTWDGYQSDFLYIWNSYHNCRI